MPWPMRPAPSTPTFLISTTFSQSVSASPRSLYVTGWSRGSRCRAPFGARACREAQRLQRRADPGPRPCARGRRGRRVRAGRRAARRRGDVLVGHGPRRPQDAVRRPFRPAHVPTGDPRLVEPPRGDAEADDLPDPRRGARRRLRAGAGGRLPRRRRGGDGRHPRGPRRPAARRRRLLTPAGGRRPGQRQGADHDRQGDRRPRGESDRPRGGARRMHRGVHRRAAALRAEGRRARQARDRRGRQAGARADARAGGPGAGDARRHGGLRRGHAGLLREAPAAVQRALDSRAMRLTLATHRLGRGGSESYLISLASELQRLGHPVAVTAVEDGPGAERARTLGISVDVGEQQPAHRADGIVVQDIGLAYALAERHPAIPQVFVAHSELFDAQLPPQMPGICTAVVVMSERVERRVRALANAPPIVRLRQPIDTERFAARETIRERPRRAVVLSNYLYGERLALLRAAWEPEGVELIPIGVEASPSDEPELLIGDADVVVGKGRAVLEGMSCGRAAYLFDMAGYDGWVTPAIYSSLEADGFAGQATGRAATVNAMRADIADYKPQMGAANRDLVTANHSLRRHAEQLVEMLAGAGAGPATARLDELERVVRSGWRLEDRASGLGRENDRLHARILELEREAEELKRTRRYRLAAAIGRPLDALRRSRR